jgi:histone-lysine N-methyltransferase SETMAR
MEEETDYVRHDNARPHASGAISEILEKYGWQVLPHPLYSPDMSPPDFELLPKFKKKNHSVGNASEALRRCLMR